MRNVLGSALRVGLSRLRANGDVQVNNGDTGSGAGVLAVGNATTAPTVNPDGSHAVDSVTSTAGFVLWAASGRQWWRGSDGVQYFGGNTESYTLSYPGALAVANGVLIVPVPFTFMVESCDAVITTPSVGSAVNFDIKGSSSPTGTFTSLFSTSPQIFANNNTISNAYAIAATTWTATSYLRLDVTQIGSTTAGSNLVVNLRLRRTA